MKAAVFYGKNDLRVEERDVPEIGRNDVLVRVHAGGICGTDVHIFCGDEGAAEYMYVRSAYSAGMYPHQNIVSADFGYISFLDS